MKSWQRIFASIFLILFLGTTLVVSQTCAQGSVGVGVGIGEIRIKEPLVPGGVYKLPSIPVINTGEVESQYEVVVENVEPNLFSFSPQKFILMPGKSQLVSARLNLPFDAKQGDYLVHLEAHPILETQPGQVALVAAVATKLYYSVGPNPNILGALKQRLSTLWDLYYPWSYILALALDFLLILLLLKGLISIRFEIKRRPKKKEQQPLPL